MIDKMNRSIDQTNRYMKKSGNTTLQIKKHRKQVLKTCACLNATFSISMFTYAWYASQKWPVFLGLLGIAGTVIETVAFLDLEKESSNNH